MHARPGIKNFIKNVVGDIQDWTSSSFAESGKDEYNSLRQYIASLRGHDWPPSL